MVVSWKVGVLGVLALVVAIGSGCGSSSDDKKKDAGGANGSSGSAGGMKLDAMGNDVGVVGNELTISFAPMYSAYIDADHPCQIPAIVNNVTGVNWTSTDSSMVQLEQDDTTGGVMITTKKAGDVLIIARADSLSGSSMLHISSFTAEEWSMGEKRYNSGVAYTPPTMAEIMAMFQMADGGMIDLSALKPDAETACTNCHGDGAMLLSVQHTSQQIGGYSDDDLVKIVTMGIKPPGAPRRTMFPPQLYMMFHNWSTDESGEHGIVAYLRSLKPKTQGMLDFGGIGGPRMGTMAPAGGTGGAAP